MLATIAALLLFTLDEMRLVSTRPRELDTAHGFVHETYLRAFGTPELIFLSSADLAIRWSLVALTVALSIWALADSIERSKAKAPIRKR
ncbi:MAG: hypothetical protein ABUL42_00360 [Terricaulis silvestris]